jgi:siroheme synthase (precorrin-2 oxidase/ferrochelatase)
MVWLGVLASGGAAKTVTNKIRQDIKEMLERAEKIIIDQEMCRIMSTPMVFAAKSHEYLQ